MDNEFVNKLVMASVDDGLIDSYYGDAGTLRVEMWKDKDGFHVEDYKRKDLEPSGEWVSLDHFVSTDFNEAKDKFEKTKKEF